MQYLSIHEVEAPPPMVCREECPHILGCMAVAVLYETARSPVNHEAAALTSYGAHSGSRKMGRELLRQAVTADTLHEVRQQCVACPIARNALYPNVYYN